MVKAWATGSSLEAPCTSGAAVGEVARGGLCTSTAAIDRAGAGGSAKTSFWRCGRLTAAAQLGRRCSAAACDTVTSSKPWSTSISSSRPVGTGSSEARISASEGTTLVVERVSASRSGQTKLGGDCTRHHGREMFDPKAIVHQLDRPQVNAQELVHAALAATAAHAAPAERRVGRCS
eukprot:scaffold11921_cov102-Isochrysis_galbana.AAC.1